MQKLGNRASANAVINAIMSKAAEGLGNSKTLARSKSEVIAQSGHKISDRVHSISSLQNLRTVTKQYINYLKENHKGRVLDNVSKETMKDFLKSKDIKGGSLNTYISTAGKLTDSLNRLNVSKISRDDIYTIRNELKQEGINLSKEYRNRSYANTEKIVEHMRENSPYGLAATLQKEAGLRIDDLSSSKWQINDDNTLTIMQSKNGLNYTTCTLNNKTISEVKEAKIDGYKIDKTQYSIALKEAVEQAGDEWTGSHGMRYSFAQERMQELVHEYDYTHSEALAEISLNMGHSRSEISLHYLNL